MRNLAQILALIGLALLMGCQGQDGGGIQGVSAAVTPFERQMSRGEYLFRLSGCVQCHTQSPAQPLAGGYALKTQFGIFYSPNITPAQTGLAKWQESDFVKALREGISPAGSPYYPAFPYSNYTKLTDQDLHELWLYLRSQPPIERANQAHDLSFPYNIRELNHVWRFFNFKSECEDAGPFGCLKAKGAYQAVASKSTEWNTGAYLVEGVLHCTQCHTPRDSLGGLKTNQWMAGAHLFGEKYPAPNLTPDPTTGLGTWQNQDFVSFFKTGLDLSGDPVGGEMARVIRLETALLTDGDLAGVIAYLRDLPAVTNNP